MRNFARKNKNALKNRSTPSRIAIVPNPAYPRYTNFIFPEYRFIPGENLHPITDPLGHSYQKKFATPDILKTENWKTNQRYLWAIDLYNHAFWWEAHEAFEGLWQITPKTDRTRDLLQGLIKICAAFLKWYSLQFRGAKILFNSGLSHLASVLEFCPQCMGINLERYMVGIRKHFFHMKENSTAKENILKDYPFIFLNRNNDDQ